MNRITFVTQLIDRDDPVLGTVPRLVSALAARTDQVDVIANEVRELPGFAGNVSVSSLGKEGGAGRASRLLSYERAVAASRARTLFAHMCPSYLAAAWPSARIRGMSTILWFAHPRVTRSLLVAERLSDVVLTSLPGSYPHPGPKVRPIGQAIDLEAFPQTPIREPDDGRLELLALGRTSDSKRYDVMIEGVRLAAERGLETRLKIVGPATTDRERAIGASLRARVSADGLGEHVTFSEGVPPDHVPTLLASSDALVSTTISGSADKAVFESIASGRPAFVSNPAFDDLLSGSGFGSRFEGAAGLADLLERFVGTGTVERQDLADRLRGRVVKEHSLDHWADSVVEIIEGMG